MRPRTSAAASVLPVRNIETAATDADWQERGANPPGVSGTEAFLAGTANGRLPVKGIETLCVQYETAGIRYPNGPLSKKPDGMREFAVLDGDDNLITPFEPIG